MLIENKSSALSKPSNSQYQLRLYQELIALQAIKTNTIAHLPTGSGKTFIAYCVIDYYLRLIRVARETMDSWPRIIIFVAPTKVLLQQQIDSIKKYTDNALAETLNKTAMFNDKKIDSWSKDEWQTLLKEYEVLGMTPEILLKLVERRILPQDTIELVVFDECHHARGNSAMARAGDAIREGGYNPRILGLTSSPVTQKRADVRQSIEMLEDKLMSAFFIPTENLLYSLHQYTVKPPTMAIEYNSSAALPASCALDRLLVLQDLMKFSSTLQNISSADRQLNRDFFAMVCQAIGINSVEPTWYKSSKSAKESLFSSLDVSRTCGLFCAVDSLSTYTLDESKKLRQLSNYNDLAFEGGEFSRHSLVVHEIDTDNLRARAIEVVTFVRGDKDLFALLINQPKLILLSYIETFFYFAKSLGYNVCQRAVEKFDSAYNTLVKSRREMMSTYLSKRQEQELQELQKLEELATQAAAVDKDNSEHVHIINNSEDRESAMEVENEPIVVISGVDSTEMEIEEEIVSESNKKIAMAAAHEDSTAAAGGANATEDQAKVTKALRAPSEIFESGFSYILREILAKAHLEEVFSVGIVPPQLYQELKIMCAFFEELNVASEALLASISLLPLQISIGLRSVTMEYLIESECDETFQDRVSNIYSDKIECVMECISTVLRGGSGSKNDSQFSYSIHQITPSTKVVPVSDQRWGSLLKRAFEKESNPSKSMVVFTDRKIIAYAMNRLFNCLFRDAYEAAQREAESGADLDLQQSELLSMGLIQSAALTADFTPIDQKNILNDFKANTYTILFASSIAEEGLDVKQCSTVINFDQPKEVKSFIQRRGRARSQHSLMLHLVPSLASNEDACEKEIEDLKKYIIEEATIDEAIRTLVESVKAGISAGDDGRYVVPSTGAYINCVAAQSLVLEYSSTFSNSDQSLYWMPFYTFHQIGSASSKSDGAEKRYQCTCHMAPVTGIQPISREANNKQQAKGLAAMEVVKVLHAKGDLDDHLRIVSRLKSDVLSAIIMKEELSMGESMSITSQLKTVSDELAAKPAHVEEQVWLSFFRVEVNAAILEGESANSLVLECLNSIGFAFLELSDEKAFEERFVLNLKGFKDARFSMKFIERRPVSSAELGLLQDFHRGMFCLEAEEIDASIPRDEVGFISVADSTDPELIPIIVPSHNAISFEQWTENSNGAWYLCFPLDSRGSIDFNVIRRCTSEVFVFLHNLSRIYQRNCNREAVADFTREVDRESFDGCVMTSNGMNIGYILPHEPCSLSLDDSMEGSEKTYSEHYSRRGEKARALIEELRVTKLNSALLSGGQLSGKLTLINLLQSFSTNFSEPNPKQYFIPELCRCIGRLRWYYTSYLLPSLGTLVLSISLARELRASLTAAITHEKLLSAGVKMPPITLFLEAMSSSRCLELLSLERLEFLGDTFLKMASSLYCYIRNDTAREGALTNERIRLLCNAHLTRQANATGYFRYLRAIPYCKGLEELLMKAPGSGINGTSSLRNLNIQTRRTNLQHSRYNLYCIPLDPALAPASAKEEVAEGVENRPAAPAAKQFEFVADLPGKVLADIMEALLGIAYLEGSESLGYLMLKALNILDCDLSEWLTPENAIRTSFGPFEALLPPLPRNTLQWLQGELGYVFRNPKLLALALTHGSFTEGRLSFERLEFLGDAVLDCIVGKVLFLRHPDWDEGQLSKGKSDLTCNKKFAVFAQRLRLLQHMRHFSTHTKSIQLIDKERNELDSARAASLEAAGGEQEEQYEQYHKITADLMEAVFGAIFLDCDYSLDTVATVVSDLGILDEAS